MVFAYSKLFPSIGIFGGALMIERPNKMKENRGNAQTNRPTASRSQFESNRRGDRKHIYIYCTNEAECFEHFMQKQRVLEIFQSNNNRRAHRTEHKKTHTHTHTFIRSQKSVRNHFLQFTCETHIFHWKMLSCDLIICMRSVCVYGTVCADTVPHVCDSHFPVWGKSAPFAQLLLHTLIENS